MAAHKKKKKKRGKKSAHALSGQSVSPTKWFWWILTFLAVVFAVAMLWGTFLD